MSGEQNPSAFVTGNAMSLIQQEWVPPKAKFAIDDVGADWVEHAQYDDFHCRYLADSIKIGHDFSARSTRILSQEAGSGFRNLPTSSIRKMTP